MGERMVLIPFYGKNRMQAHCRGLTLSGYHDNAGSAETAQ